jgi:ElaB/YqjD/DUF883 family membrane-anchored ribosome-binding protein
MRRLTLAGLAVFAALAVGCERETPPEEAATPREQYRELKEESEEALEQAREKAEAAMDEAREKTEEAIDEASEQAQEAVAEMETLVRTEKEDWLKRTSEELTQLEKSFDTLRKEKAPATAAAVSAEWQRLSAAVETKRSEVQDSMQRLRSSSGDELERVKAEIERLMAELRALLDQARGVESTPPPVTPQQPQGE